MTKWQKTLDKKTMKNVSLSFLKKRNNTWKRFFEYCLKFKILQKHEISTLQVSYPVEYWNEFAHFFVPFFLSFRLWRKSGNWREKPTCYAAILNLSISSKIPNFDLSWNLCGTLQAQVELKNSSDFLGGPKTFPLMEKRAQISLSDYRKTNLCTIDPEMAMVTN